MGVALDKTITNTRATAKVSSHSSYMHRMDKSKESRYSRGSKVIMNSPVKDTEKKSSTAAKEVPVAVPQLGYKLSKPLQGQTQEGGAISLKGLLAAQRFSKGLRERATLKLAVKKGAGVKALKSIMIINEKVASGSAQPLKHFPCVQVMQLLQGFMASRLEGVSYETTHSSQLVQDLSEDLKGLVRVVCPCRYKLVCMLTLGQTEWESIFLASRCLWDPNSDTVVSHTYKSPHVFCTATVFAMYSE